MRLDIVTFGVRLQLCHFDVVAGDVRQVAEDLRRPLLDSDGLSIGHKQNHACLGQHINLKWAAVRGDFMALFACGEIKWD